MAFELALKDRYIEKGGKVSQQWVQCINDMEMEIKASVIPEVIPFGWTVGFTKTGMWK